VKQWLGNNGIVRRVESLRDRLSVSTPGPDLSVWRPWAGSLLEATVVGAGVVVCLEQGADNSI